MAEDKPLPCPFCGAKLEADINHYLNIDHYRENNWIGWIECSKCQSRGPVVHPARVDRKAEALRLWNQRASIETTASDGGQDGQA